MIKLHTLKNSHRPKKKVQRLGRGPGSKRGKTSGRGEKGDGSRSGYKRRFGYEGGQFPLFKKLPIRGFTRGRFIEKHYAMNLCDIDKFFNDGDTVSLESLYQKKMIGKTQIKTLRILSKGELKKKVSIEAHHFSEKAKEKLEKNNISYKLLSV